MRYNGIGISTELYKNLLYKPKYSDDYYLDIPKPTSDIEFTFLADFIYGVNIGISKFTFTSRNVDKVCPPNKTFDNLSIEDYRAVDYDLAEVTYKLNMDHSKYFDSKFNKEVHTNSFEMDHIVMRSIFGKHFNSGVAIQAFGGCKIFNIDEYYRLRQWYHNRTNKLDIAREDFIDTIQNLNILNKKLAKL